MGHPMTAGEVKPISSILHPMKTKGQQYACAHYRTTVLAYACHFYLIYMTIVADMLPVSINRVPGINHPYE